MKTVKNYIKIGLCLVALSVMELSGVRAESDALVVEENEDFIIEDGVLVKYNGSSGHVEVPEGVTVIGKKAFADLGGRGSVSLPEGVTRIEDRAFYGFLIENINLPDSLQSIGEEAFGYASLETIRIPKGVKEIGKAAFAGDRITITLDEGNENYVLEDDILYRKTETGLSLMKCNYSKAGLCELSEEVVEIEDYAFEDCGLEEVMISDSVKKIGEGVFSECENLKKVTLPKTLSVIEDELFGGCSSLTHVTIPDSVKEIGEYAFSYCEKLENITLPKGITKIGNDAFTKSGLNSITLPEGVSSIGNEAFLSCSGLTKVVIPGNVKKIGDDSFGNCGNLKKVTLKKGVKSLGSNAFDGCKRLGSITLPKSVSKIGLDALSGIANVRIKAGAKIRANLFAGQSFPVRFAGKVSGTSKLSTSKKKVVKVSKWGVITAKKKGNAKITLKNGKKKVILMVKVKK